MAKIECPKAKQAFVIANIKKTIGAGKRKAALTTSAFNGIMQGAYDTQLTSPEEIAQEFKMSTQDARNFTKRNKAPNTNQQKKIISLIVKKNNIR